MIALASHPATAALCALLWGVMACLLPFLRLRWRHSALWALVLCGVPVLGWMTYLCGPGFGVLFLALGLSLLVWPPFDPRRRRRALTQRGLR
ncbi:DUF2484 family protein [Paracoccus sp. P2]|uniref:DUF2484 family protein n=1 Tax=Paracoccus pantotrophus TaxID=82367 RepID=A0A1I5J9A5_PARPN|nr:DUF2484 family protein [Paracoccus pantotrophus]MDF3855382.1 DUF2484 family protein [Paracoccus pantotrophus]QFG35842.1 DUF2484 family protein [Paracoccus pantotrophus]QLH14139.1 DUF2484 family protein [Paracoccus pantotrophus]RDD95527.1 DUF2484 family protein [Paracoccus pantotrophus]RKS43900.1 uncharacterized protein DUF2484 [Paracoccus pantotrophus]